MPPHVVDLYLQTATKSVLQFQVNSRECVLLRSRCQNSDDSQYDGLECQPRTHLQHEEECDSVVCAYTLW